MKKNLHRNPKNPTLSFVLRFERSIVEISSRASFDLILTSQAHLEVTQFWTISTGAYSLRFKHSLKHATLHTEATSFALSATDFASWVATPATSLAVTTVAAAASFAELATTAADVDAWETTSFAWSTTLTFSIGVTGVSTLMLTFPKISSDFSLIAWTTLSVVSSIESFYCTADKTSSAFMSLLILSRIAFDLSLMSLTIYSAIKSAEAFWEAAPKTSSALALTEPETSTTLSFVVVITSAAFVSAALTAS